MTKIKLFFRYLLAQADRRGWLDGTIYEGYDLYCPRCGGCGEIGCCGRRCDKGFCCMKMYDHIDTILATDEEIAAHEKKMMDEWEASGDEYYKEYQRKMDEEYAEDMKKARYARED